MVNGVPGNEHKAFDNFKDAVAWLSSAGHDTFHFCEGPADGPEPKSPGHGGESKCYVATGGRGAAIFTRYRYACLHNASIEGYDVMQRLD